MEKSNVFAHVMESLGVDTNPVTVWGHINTPAEETILASNEWQPVKALFHNDIIEGFIYGDDNIIYSGNVAKAVMICGVFTVTSDKTNNTICFGIKKKGVLIEGSDTNRLIKLTTDIASWSGICSTILNPGDDIQIVMRSDKVGSVVTIEHFQVNMVQVGYYF